MLGVDLGTSATKVVAVDENMRLLGESERSYPLRTEHGDEAVQDPEQVFDATMEGIRERVQACTADGREVAGLSFSAALHTLLATDGDGKPVTPALSWADTRAAGQAKRIRAEHAPALVVETGTPVHPMSPLTKLAWFAENEPETQRAARRWCGLKDYILGRMCETFVTDLSCASATGMLDLRSRDWHAEALRLADVSREKLPELVAPTDTFGMCAEIAESLGLPEGLPVAAGAGDGPLANLGVGAIRHGTAALSVGTSGALRVTRESPTVDKDGRVFCYYLADDLWVTGGAVSNGGKVAQWAADTFDRDVAALMEEAAGADSGSLIALPYLLGERAPWWDPDPRGALIGLRAEHGRAEIARALVEGVAQQLALVLDSIRDAGADPHAIRATGGALRSELWVDALAAALQTPLGLADEAVGSGYGAALLGWRALDVLPSLDRAADIISPRRTVNPDSDYADRLRSTRPMVGRIYHSLVELAEQSTT
jgi:gluconokinase